MGTGAISPAMAQKYLDNSETRLLVGRHLWEFVSGEKDFHKKVLTWIDEAVDEDIKKSSIDREIQAAISRILKEFKSRYGKDENGIQKYIDDII